MSPAVPGPRRPPAAISLGGTSQAGEVHGVQPTAKGKVPSPGPNVPTLQMRLPFLPYIVKFQLDNFAKALSELQLLFRSSVIPFSR